MSDTVELWTDGACSGNPGPGGWAAILRWNGNERELVGGEQMTTNNRMELMSVIAGLEAITRPMRVLVHTDSAYVEQAFAQRWLEGWRRNGWKTAAKKPVKNRDLWERLDAAVNGHDVEFVRVKGHAGVELNERADQLACEQRDVHAARMTGRKDHARSLFAGIAGDYDRWAQLLSFGQDARWHRVMIEPLELAAGDVVADVATGTAAVAIDLVRRHGCRVIGIDQSPEMLARGARAGRRRRALRVDRAAPGRGGAASARGRLGRCPHPHVPAPLRRRPGGDAARAGARSQARRRDGVARVLRPGRWVVPGMVGLDARRPAGRRVDRR